MLLSLLALLLPQRASVPGTYDILICKGACGFDSSENVLVRGSLVLEDQTFPSPSASWDPIRFDWLSFPHGTANACFVLATIEAGRTYAGQSGNGFTTWSLAADKLTLRLFASPDAGYEVSVVLDKEGFSGIGTSTGAGVGAPPSSRGSDVVIGRRAGPANRAICMSDRQEPRSR